MKQPETGTIVLETQKVKEAMYIKAWSIALFGIFLLLNLLLFRGQLTKWIPFIIQSVFSLLMWFFTLLTKHKECHSMETNQKLSFISFIKMAFSLDVCLLYLLQLFLSVLLFIL